ncbi:MAG: DUF115 domain-containing protein [Nitrosopumilus sp.]|nr:DUF115 domain-containing protein [Nitrosopumilus sp.]MDA7953077.1 DUF115 domain-containing protein [Nitrosopumilus sp.]MDA7958393.1 DUF115 domain-containing protein [Nitrosopumilus sp.]
MAVRGWRAIYRQIVDEFGYDEAADRRAARKLGGILAGARDAGPRVSSLVRGRPVLVAGAGPSLGAAMPLIRQARATRIAAGSAAGALLRAGITPEIIVTDLDGDLEPLLGCPAGPVYVVHAHGDNGHLLHHAASFKRCLGTAQAGASGMVADYGGFTDGDRAVFLARHFGASRIVLAGMDFGTRIGRHSRTPARERRAKLAKLDAGRRVLEWLASRPGPPIYTISGGLEGPARIRPGGMARLLE